MAPNTKNRPASRVRLYCETDLGPDRSVTIAGGPHHHLHTVLRARVGDDVLLFNGRDGEWLTRIETTGPKRTSLIPRHRTREQESLPDVWLVFSPLTKERTNYAVEKATELGVARLCPVTMIRTRPCRIVPDRLRSVAIGAAQQCGGLAIPEIRPLQSLAALIADWPPERRLFHCDESLALRPDPPDILAHAGPKAVLVGPEGGFDPCERALLQGRDFTRSLSLGRRILRAETAVVASLALLHVLAPVSAS